MLELTHIRKAFNQGQHNEYWALKGIDLEIPPAQVSVLKGPSGSGKTTLLTILGCLARPTEGRVRLKGEDISGLPERFLTEIRRSTFGFIFQQFNLIRGMSALENVMLPAYPLGQNWRELRAHAEALLADLKLAERRDARVECYPVASNSALPWHAPLRHAHNSSWPTSRPAISTQRLATRSSSLCSRLTQNAEQR